MSPLSGFVARVAVALAIAAGAAAPPVVHLARPAGEDERAEAGAGKADRPDEGEAGEELGVRERGEVAAEETAGEDRLRGLDTAIARVSANLRRHPNRGLANAVERLEENRARREARGAAHDARRAARAGEVDVDDGGGRG